MEADDTSFSPDYATARARFKAACEDGLCGSFVLADQQGPRGETLAMDWAYFGPENPEAAAISLSGVHGVEGFTGSAIQLDWLAHEKRKALPPKTGLLIVHGVNPYGFAYLSRCTEDHVDLNRNWVDFAEPLPRNFLYEKLHRILSPLSVDLPAQQDLWHQLKLMVTVHGKSKVERAMTAGQFSHEDGMCFGGQAPAWSRTMLLQLIKERFAPHTRLALLDWHTGATGVGGEVHIPLSPSHSNHLQRLASWWGPEGGAAANSLRRELRHGLVVDGLARDLHKEGYRVVGGIIDFGTCEEETGEGETPTLSVLAHLYDRFLSLSGERMGADYSALRHFIFSVYNRPWDRVWKERVLSRAQTLTRATLEGLSDWCIERPRGL